MNEGYPHNSLFKIVWLHLLLILGIWLIIGSYLVWWSFNVAQFAVPSPPQALYGGTLFDFYFRLLDLARQVPYPVLRVERILIIFPYVSLLLFLILRRKGNSKLKIVLWSIIGVVVCTLAHIGFFVAVPASMDWVAFRMAVSSTVGHSQKLLSQEKLTYNDAALAQALRIPGIKIYADYGSGGTLLAVFYNEKKSQKLTLYESFYLPLYFAHHAVIPEAIKEKSPEMIFVPPGSLIINNVETKDRIKAIILPVSQTMLTHTFGHYISASPDRLKAFEIFDDSVYADKYLAKVRENWNKDISQNEQAYAINNEIIKDYPALQTTLEANYQKYVLDEQIDYQKNCVAEVRYNNCSELQKTIDDNIRIVSDDKDSALKNYNEAIANNKKISSFLVEEREHLNNLTKDDSLDRNLGEYSTAVTLNYEVVYLRTQPLREDTFRLFIHELLHVYSRNGLPDVINEGMTDYLAMKTMNYDDLDKVRAAGYPLEVQVIMALLEVVPEDELTSLYFNSTEKEWRALMKKYFPHTDYQSFMRDAGVIFEGTYHTNQQSYTLAKGLFDHPEVQTVREDLGLPKTKFDGAMY